MWTIERRTPTRTRTVPRWDWTVSIPSDKYKPILWMSSILYPLFKCNPIALQWPWSIYWTPSICNPGPFTDVPYDSMNQCATDAWIKTLWKSCQEFDISIADPFGDLHLSRTEDQFLMVAFEKRKYSPRKLHILNLCRMFWEMDKTLSIWKLEFVSLSPVGGSNGTAVNTLFSSLLSLDIRVLSVTYRQDTWWFLLF